LKINGVTPTMGASLTFATTVGTSTYAGAAVPCSDKTGFALAADQAVNATKIGGTLQTAGRDLGTVLPDNAAGQPGGISVTPPFTF